MAAAGTDADKSVSARRILRIIFLHSGNGKFRSRLVQGPVGRIAGAANRNIKRSEALVIAAKFAAVRLRIMPTSMEPRRGPNRLIFMPYLLADLFRHGLLQETPADS
jgi:hypothetical protein